MKIYWALAFCFTSFHFTIYLWALHFPARNFIAVEWCSQDIECNKIQNVSQPFYEWCNYYSRSWLHRPNLYADNFYCFSFWRRMWCAISPHRFSQSWRCSRKPRFPFSSMQRQPLSHISIRNPISPVSGSHTNGRIKIYIFDSFAGCIKFHPIYFIR